METSIFTVKWDLDSTYELYYKNDLIGTGMAPQNLVDEYVRLMNWAYEQGASST